MNKNHTKMKLKQNPNGQRDLHRIAKSEKNTKPLQELIPQSILCSATYLRFCHLLTQQSHLDQEKLIFDMLHEKIAVMEAGHFRTASTNCRGVAGLMSRF